MTITKIARALVADHVRTEIKMAGIGSFLRRPSVRIPGMALSAGALVAGSAALANDDLNAKELIALGLLGGAGGAFIRHKLR